MNMYFHPKLVDHLLRMMSYLVTVANDHHQPCLKICAKDEQTATEDVRF